MVIEMKIAPENDLLPSNSIMVKYFLSSRFKIEKRYCCFYQALLIFVRTQLKPNNAAQACKTLVEH